MPARSAIRFLIRRAIKCASLTYGRRGGAEYILGVCVRHERRVRRSDSPRSRRMVETVGWSRSPAFSSSAG